MATLESRLKAGRESRPQAMDRAVQRQAPSPLVIGLWGSKVIPMGLARRLLRELQSKRRYAVSLKRAPARPVRRPSQSSPPERPCGPRCPAATQARRRRPGRASVVRGALEDLGLEGWRDPGGLGQLGPVETGALHQPTEIVLEPNPDQVTQRQLGLCCTRVVDVKDQIDPELQRLLL